MDVPENMSAQTQEQNLVQERDELDLLRVELTRAYEERDRFFTLPLGLLCIAGFDGYFKRLNAAFEGALGFTLDELLAEPFMSLVHPDDYAATADVIQQLASGTQLVFFENRFRRKDGSYCWLTWAAAPALDQRLIYAAAHDITRHKQIEEALSQHNRELIDLNAAIATFAAAMELDQVLQAVVVAAPRLFPRAQDATLQLLDETSGELVTWAASRGLYSVPRQVVFKPGQGITGLAMAERRPINVADVTTHPNFIPILRGPSCRSLLVAPLLVSKHALGTLSLEGDRPAVFSREDENLVQLFAGYAAIAIENARLYALAQQEIAERKQAEERLRLTNTAMESTANAIVITDRAGYIMWVNPAFQRLTGYTPDEATGNTLRLLQSDQHPASFYRQLWETILAGQVWQGELVNRRKDGSLYTEEQTITPVCDERGEITHFIGIKQDITERKRLEEALRREVELAGQVQASMLPRHVPSFEGFEFAAAAFPARYVSGDLYDFNVSGSDICHLVVADISGKGIPAAMLTLTARALWQAESVRHSSPATILSNVNALLYQKLSQAELFITFWIARLDAWSGSLAYVNAGHTETIWWRQADRTCHTLPATTLPIGIIPDAPMVEETIALRPGDVLVFYSDGITEAANSHEELYGFARLQDSVCANAHLPARELVEVIVKAVESFREESPLSDDLTLIVLKALPRTAPFNYPATLDSLEKMTGLIHQLTSAYGQDFAYQLQLATSEIVTNIIQHAYRSWPGTIRSQLGLLPDRVQLDVYDDGAPFDPSLLQQPDLSEPHEGGYGLFIVRQLVDELVYEPASSAGNHWRLVKIARG
ncbi:MAG: SpoIIE family protein phosphatase [Thermoflexales bacterium]|nr:SpoIIE family protein phosphatase [Thermoflexales bacterium]